MQSNLLVPTVRANRSTKLSVKLTQYGIAVTGVTTADIAGAIAWFMFNTGEELQLALTSSNWLENGEGLYSIVVPASMLTAERVGPFQWTVIPDDVANAFDGAGFVGYGVLEDFQDAAQNPSNNIMAAATRNGVMGTIGGALRLVMRHFGGRVKLDATAKTRTIFDETNTVALTSANTLDNLGNPSADPVFESVAPPDASNPTVLSQTPAPSTTGVARNSVIIVTFDKPMDESTVTSSNIELFNGATQLECDVEYVNGIATVYPNQLLPALTLLTMTFTSALKDLSGNTLTPPSIWTFTTGS